MDRVAPAWLTLVGQSDIHLCSDAEAAAVGARVHMEAVPDFLALQSQASEAGFDLRIHSAYRDFARQLSIWNRKASGERAVLDSSAEPIDIGTLHEPDLVAAILRWSALPGASRHHWGTDLDVYDAASTPDGYELQLIPAEVDPGGMHGPLHAWLDERIAAGTSFGFYRPYDIDRGGVAPERWHLSHAPLATAYLRLLTPAMLRTTIEGADMRLKDVVLDMLDDLYQRFVINISKPQHLGSSSRRAGRLR